MTGHLAENFTLISANAAHFSGRSSSVKIADAGHSGSHAPQSMHSSGSITSMLAPSWKQSTGHVATHSVYLHLMQGSATTYVMRPSQSEFRAGMTQLSR